MTTTLLALGRESHGVRHARNHSPLMIKNTPNQITKARVNPIVANALPRFRLLILLIARR